MKKITVRFEREASALSSRPEKTEDKKKVGQIGQPSERIRLMLVAWQRERSSDRSGGAVMNPK